MQLIISPQEIIGIILIADGLASHIYGFYDLYKTNYYDNPTKWWLFQAMRLIRVSLGGAILKLA